MFINNDDCCHNFMRICVKREDVTRWVVAFYIRWKECTSRTGFTAPFVLRLIAPHDAPTRSRARSLCTTKRLVIPIFEIICNRILTAKSADMICDIVLVCAREGVTRPTVHFTIYFTNRKQPSNNNNNNNSRRERVVLQKLHYNALYKIIPCQHSPLRLTDRLTKAGCPVLLTN